MATNNFGNNNTTTNNLRDIYNYLQPPQHANGYDHIIDMMRGLDLQDDGIAMNNKIKMIETDFCNIVQNENMLWESMEYMNTKALEDSETALKFALLFSSRNFDALAMNKVKVRTNMLTILEKNFMNAELLRAEDRERLYNSITLLGEYYHRVRLCDNTPIAILGESLLDLLIRQVRDNDAISAKQAKLLLSQITLNGGMMRQYLATGMTQLFFHIRRSLIEQPALTSPVKAMLLMAIDLYYSNFSNLGADLEEMYTKYLVLDHEERHSNEMATAQQNVLPPSNYNNNNSIQNEPIVIAYQQQQQSPVAAQMSPQQQQQQQQLYNTTPTHHQQQQQQQQQLQYVAQQQQELANSSYENGELPPLPNDSFEASAPPSPAAPSQTEATAAAAAAATTTKPTKKWSEQVYEDLCDQELANCDSGYNKSINSGGTQEREHEHEQQHEQQPQQQSFRNGMFHEGGGGGASSARTRNSRRSQHNKQHAHSNSNNNNNSNGSRSEDNHNTTGSSGVGGGGEELDETKPLPRWRATRFNRENNGSGGEGQKHSRHNQPQPQRRYSASFDDDGQSVRSEGGSIRLYSINDRLKHSQEKIERTGMGGNAYNYIANSNWDRQSQRDDRSERSYISNYECGSYRRGGRRNHHHRQSYDKPPRFQKQHQQQQQQQQNSHSQHGEHKIHSESWRRSVYADENTNDYNHGSANGNAELSNSRSSSRARTLPRPSKSQWENSSAGGGGSGGGGGGGSNNPTHYRRSQSPNTHHNQQQRQQQHQHQRPYGGSGGGGGGGRYSSQSSLASECSNTLERRRNQRNRSGGFAHHRPQTHATHKDWHAHESQQQHQHQQQQQQQQRQHDSQKTGSAPLPPNESNDQHLSSNTQTDVSSELLRNARQTTKYMNYLSSQK